jgi:hypothetical protein
MIQGFYTGCINSGNIGDDVLFNIFLNLLSECIVDKYKVNCSIDQNQLFLKDSSKEWMENSSIGVVGGGSILHPEEISYSGPIKNYESNIKASLLFGTGISDTPNFKISESDKLNILSGKYLNLNFPINKMMSENILIAKNIKFGGLRGPLDVAVCRSFDETFRKPWIYDPGLLFNRYYNLNSLKNKNSNIIGINIANISGDNRISLKNEKYIDYMNRLESVIVDVCNFLINKNYKIYFYSMSDGEMHLHNTIINKLDKNLIGSNILTHNKPLNYVELALLSSTFKFAIATRLHANILLNSNLIPTINLMYNIKASNYMKSIEMLELGVPTDSNMNLNNIINKYNFLMQNYDNIIKTLKFNVEKAYTLHYDEIMKLLYGINLKIENDVNIQYQIYNSILGFFKIN